MKQLIIVSNYHYISDVIKNMLIFETYDPIVLSSLDEARKAFNRGSFAAILFVDYQGSNNHSDDDENNNNAGVNLDEIIDGILKKTKKTVIMEHIYSKPQYDTKIIAQYDNLHIINGATKPNEPYNPEKLITLLRQVFNQNDDQNSTDQSTPNELNEQGTNNNHDNPINTTLSYKNFTLDTKNLTMTVNGKGKYITPAQCNLLAYFMQNQGAVISKTSLILDYLNKNDVYVWSEFLDDNVKQLQELIGDNPKKPKIIKLIEGIGYYITPEQPLSA